MPVETYTLTFVGVCAVLIVATLAFHMASEAVGYLRRGCPICALVVLAGVGVLLGVAATMSINLFHFATA